MGGLGGPSNSNRSLTVFGKGSLGRPLLFNNSWRFSPKCLCVLIKLFARLASLDRSFADESWLNVAPLMRKILNELWMLTCSKNRSVRCLSTFSRRSFGMYLSSSASTSFATESLMHVSISSST